MKIIILLVLFLISCSTCKKSIDKPLLDDIKTDMASFNKTLKGYLYRYRLNSDLRSLSEALYLSSLNERIKPSQKEYFEFIKSQSPEISLRTTKTDFVICLKAIRVELILCDKASTGMLDIVEKNMKVNIGEFISEIKM